MAARVQANVVDLLEFHTGLNVDSPLCWPSRVYYYVLKNQRFPSLELNRFTSNLGIRESNKNILVDVTPPQKSTHFLFIFDIKVRSKFISGLNYLNFSREDVYWSGGITPPFLTSALDGVEWSASFSGYFTLEKGLSVPFRQEGL
jgi:hypothetical protein